MNTEEIQYQNFFKLNFIEIWFLIYFIIIIFLSLKINLFILPISFLISKSIFFAFVFVIIFVATLFTKNKYKNEFIISFMMNGLEFVLDFESNFDFDSINDETIIILNYPACLVEFLFVPFFLHKTKKDFCIMIKHKQLKYAECLLNSNSLITVDNIENNFNNIIEKIQNLKQKNLIVYPEKNVFDRKNLNHIQIFRNGIFEIAKILKRKILLGYVQHIEHFCGIIITNKIKLKFEYCNEYDNVSAFNQMCKLQLEI